MGRKCSALECQSDSSKVEDVGVTFHKIPVHPDIRPKWMALCKIPGDRQSTKIIYICSRHFLRADFCSYKGKKYMLRHGVLPSVFAWTKGKASKGTAPATSTQKSKKESKKPVIKTEESIPEHHDVKPTHEELTAAASTAVKEEVMSPNSIIEEEKAATVTGPLSFTPDERIEALDFNQTWCPARIIEVDYEENEVLVHFEQYSNKYDEWISMSSNALRAIRTPAEEKPEVSANVVVKSEFCIEFEIGERCMASWSDSRKFPATIERKIEPDSYEVRFDDGFLKTLKGHRISKCQLQSMQASPLFDASKVTKQERRDRKRKLDIPALFGKRSRAPSQENSSDTVMSPTEEYEAWSPSWSHGQPVGIESAIETSDGLRRSVIVPDPRIPPKWQKHLSQRIHGLSAGKWDTFIVGPEGRKFRTRAELRVFIEENPQLKLSDGMFDFSIYRRSRPRQKQPAPEVYQEPLPPVAPPVAVEPEIEETDQNSLKIPIVDNAYKCPIEGCGKNFRRANLAQMHVKHYHPEYTKFLDSTPNVADLAYARTVGESLDRSPGVEKRIPSRQSIKTSTPKTVTPKLSQSPSVDEQIKPPAPKKDQEIIKLLNSKPIDNIKQEMPSLHTQLLTDIKKDHSLSYKRDEMNMRATRPAGSGIKTILPVVRPSEIKLEDLDSPKPSSKQVKRKRVTSEPQEPIKPKEEPLPLAPEPSNVIIEGGEVIKIVRMKLEEIINCTCGITEEDGLMIQCELCLCWQHAYCNNIARENEVPDKYICYICQNPVRQRTSKKYFHDQDWLKHGTLPVGSYHCKDEDILQKRFEKLKKSHDLSGGMLELKGFMHTMKMKMKIAEAKNHPKLYLWSKPWDKSALPELEETKRKPDASESMLFNLLKAEKDIKLKSDLPELDINSLMDAPPTPNIPQPEAAIESDDCRLNLLEHISHCQSLIEQRLDVFEQQLSGLDFGLCVEEEPEDSSRTRQTTQMVMRDLNTLNELSQITSF